MYMWLTPPTNMQEVLPGHSLDAALDKIFQLNPHVGGVSIWS